MAMFCIFLLLFTLPSLFALDPYTTFTQLNLPAGLSGPESVALDPLGRGPYVGISDGRILKYLGPNISFVEFAYTSPRRTKQCDGVTDPNQGPTCGRILGFSFSPFPLLGFLYIIDAFQGLFVVGPTGGRAISVAAAAGGVPFKFLNAIDVNPVTGDVYVIDSSLTYDFRNLTDPKLVRDSTGRLIKYSPITRQTTVVLDGLGSPAGVAVSRDGSFLLFSETVNYRVVRYWLRGQKANTVETLLSFNGTGILLKLKRASTQGDFWVPFNQFVPSPQVTTPFGYKINSNGQILIQKDFSPQYNNARIQVVQEYNNGAKLYVGSRSKSFIGIYTKT